MTFLDLDTLEPPEAPARPVPARLAPILLAAEGLRRSFAHRRATLFRKAARFHAIDGVSLELRRGETLGIVGESGCGKSTLGRLLAGLMRPDSGSVWFSGDDLAGLSGDAWRSSRRAVQMIFQDAPGSLDPRLAIEDQVREPLELHAIGTPAERRRRAAAMLEAVKLGEQMWPSVPGELSGGQQQRVVIARALILGPELLICDEPVSALDVSIQAQIVTLLKDMRRQMGLSMIFISHDLSVVRHIADRVAVMYLGQVVETGPCDLLFECPAHPYTQALVAAVPIPDPTASHRRRLLKGDPPSPHNPPGGCRFHTRCVKAAPLCATAMPLLREAGPRQVACHFPEDQP